MKIAILKSLVIAYFFVLNLTNVFAMIYQGGGNEDVDFAEYTLPLL
jgi:hypothetical protein